MGAKLGLDAKVYRLTTGTRATAGSATAGVVTAAAPANLDEVTCVQNVTWELTKGSADDMVALMAAYLTNSIAAFYIASGDKVTSGTQGLWADFQVHTASKTENLEEGQMITFTLKPTLTDVPPEWLKIT
jgi:hypothetical protein